MRTASKSFITMILSLFMRQCINAILFVKKFHYIDFNIFIFCSCACIALNQIIQFMCICLVCVLSVHCRINLIDTFRLFGLTLRFINVTTVFPTPLQYGSSKCINLRSSIVIQFFGRFDNVLILSD